MDDDGAQADAAHLQHLADLERHEHHGADDRVGRLVRLAARLTRAAAVAEVCEAVAAAGAAELRADNVVVYLLDEEEQILTLTAQMAFDRELLGVYHEVAYDDALPIGESLRTGQAVTYSSIEERNRRWPAVTQRTGSSTVVTAPMLVHDDRRIGVIAVGWLDERVVEDADRVFVQAVADLCGAAVDRAQLYEVVRRRSENLAHALESRIVIEQAKGVLAGRHGLDVDEAFTRLRTAARTQRRRIHDLAQAVVDGREDLPA